MSECEACGFVPESVRSDPRILAHHALLASRDAEIARLTVERNSLRATLQMVSAISGASADITRPFDPMDAVRLYPEAARQEKKSASPPSAKPMVEAWAEVVDRTVRYCEAATPHGIDVPKLRDVATELHRLAGEAKK